MGVNIRDQFLRMFEEQADGLFRHCYLRVLDRDSGRKLVEQTFSRLWVYVRDVRDVRDMQSLLYRIANGFIHEHRRDLRRRKIEQPVVQDEENADLLSYLGTLDEEERDIVVMHYVDRPSVEDVANMLESSPSSVMRRLGSSMQALCSRISRE